jgi:hypothetical protein
LQLSSLPLQLKKLPCKSLEGICNVAKSRLKFPQFFTSCYKFLTSCSVLFCVLQLANKNNPPMTTLRTEQEVRKLKHAGNRNSR